MHDHFHAQTLQKNLAVLEILDPVLAERLLTTPLERPDTQLKVLETGWPTVVLTHRARPWPLYATPEPLLEAQAWIDAALPRTELSPSPGSPPPTVVLVGMGLGYELQILLERLPQHATLWIYEPDLLLITLTLSRLDLSELLIEGRVKLAAGMALTELGQALPAHARLLMAPRLEPLMRWENQTLGHLIAHKLDALKGETRPSPLEVQGESLQRPLRVCLVHGGLFFEDLAFAWGKRKDEVHLLFPERHSDAELVSELNRVKPDLVMSVDLVNGLGDVCSRVVGPTGATGVPYVVWEINPRVYVVPRPSLDASRLTHLFTYRLRHVNRYQGYGYQHVSHLPLATTPEWRRPLELPPNQREKYRADISFVGYSLVNEDQKDVKLAQEFLRSKAQDGPPGERRRWIEALAILRDAVEAQHHDLLRPLLIEHLEAGWARLGLTPELEIDGQILDLRIVYSRMFGSRRRCLALQALGTLGVAVYGDPGWQKIPMEGVYYRGPAEHGEELTTLYNVSSINVDIGRLYQLDIVTMRVFDILASGGFALVEHSEELPSVLEPDREVVAWSTWDELLERAAYYIAHPEERRRIVEAGRARILREHTMGARLEHIVHTLQERRVLFARRLSG